MITTTKKSPTPAVDKVDKSAYDEAKQISSMDELVKFINKMADDGEDTYVGAIYAANAAALATLWFINRRLHLTGFQADCVMWEFLYSWEYISNKCGLRIIDYDKMLHPENGYLFNKTIPQDIFTSLQQEAKQRLKDAELYGNGLSNDVRKHLQSIVDGEYPFGYVLQMEDEI